MVANSSYHRVPEAEEEGRESIETAPGEDERLLDPLYEDDLEDDGHSPLPPKKTVFGSKISLHPTFFLRLWVITIFFVAIIIATKINRRIHGIPTIVLCCIAIVRNVYVLYGHLATCASPRIRIRIEIVRKNGSPSYAKTEKSPSARLPLRLLQVATDWVLIILMLASTLVGTIGAEDICAWVGLPLYALSTIDMGRPSRFRFASGFSYDTRN